MKASVLVATLLFFASSALGSTYTWVDDQGTVNFTEDYGCIPKKFRKKAKVLGEDEPEQAESAESESPRKRVKPDAAPETKEKLVVEGQVAKKAAYGGKDASVWKAEFAKVNADLKAAEDQLVQLRGRLADTSKMSRGEYLSIQMTIKNTEARVLDLRTKRDALVEAANRAMVPEDCR